MMDTAVDTLAQPLRQSTEMYRTKVVEGLHVRPAHISDDQKLVKLIAESMPSNGVLLSFERYPSYFKATQTQYEQPWVMVMAADDQPEKILAMFNLGSRRCYINGMVKPLRYVGDLRIGKTTRGKGLMNLFMLYVKHTFPDQEIYQTVILNDNVIARKVLHANRPGVPAHYVSDQVETHTLTGFKVQKPLNPNLSVTHMTRVDINPINRFIQHMSDYYNFLPSYDFKELLAQQPYWNGLSINDFYIIRRGGQIVGLFGLWNQKSFKQTRIADYSKLIAFVRPAYNYWAKLTHQLRLPQKGNTLNYMMLHSALCNPYDTELYENILRIAHQKSTEKKCYAMCFTLAENDPRRDCKKVIISQKVQAIHAFHCFKDNPLKQFDAKRISYLECGRI